MNQNNIDALGILEQNLASLVSQRQTLQKQLLDISQAQEEVAKVEDAYQIVGTIMIKKNAEDLSKELDEKKETLTIKVSSVQKQEEQIRKQLQTLQDEVMKNLQSGE